MKLFTSLAVGLMLAVGGLALATGPAQAGSGYPGTVHVTCHFGVHSPQRQGPHHIKVGFNAETGGNGVPRGRFIATSTSRNGKVSRTFFKHYSGGLIHYAGNKLPRGHYTVKMTFQPPTGSVYKGCQGFRSLHVVK